MRSILLSLIAGLSLTACLNQETPLLPAMRLATRSATPQELRQHVVYLSDAKGTFCGGLLLSRASLVTAEHCFDGRQDPMRAITLRQDILTVGEVVARGEHQLTAYAPSARDLAVASVWGTTFPVNQNLPRLERPLLKGEIAQAWIPSLDENGAVQLSQKNCPVLGQAAGVIELNCTIKPGASGSPLLIEEEGQMVLAGVLVARGRDDTAGIAIAAHAHLLLSLQASP